MGSVGDEAKRLGEEIQRNAVNLIRAEEAKETPDPERLRVGHEMLSLISDDPQGFVFKVMDEYNRESQEKEAAWWAKWGFLTGAWTFYLGLATGLLRPWDWLGEPLMARVIKWGLGVFGILIALLTLEKNLEEFRAKRRAKGGTR